MTGIDWPVFALPGKEAIMRRLLVILAGVAVVPSGIACQHVAGRCDCQPLVSPCGKYGLFTMDHLAPATVQPVGATIKATDPTTPTMNTATPATVSSGSGM